MPSEFWRSNKDLRKRPLQIVCPPGAISGGVVRNPEADEMPANFSGKLQQTKPQLRVDDALSVLPIGPLVFSMRKTMRLSLRSVISTLSPVSRMRLGMSITESGSVHSTSRRSPAASDFSALRVFNAGSGHFRPARSSFVVVMLSTWRERRGSSTTSVDEARVGEKADGVAGRDLRDVLAEFGETVGVGKRGQQARALARKFGRFEHAVGALAQGNANIFAARDLLLVGE